VVLKGCVASSTRCAMKFGCYIIASKRKFINNFLKINVTYMYVVCDKYSIAK
jgi:hypothetical protein